MASLNTIARPYAKAIFEEACASGSLSDWGSVLFVLRLVSEDQLLAEQLKNPAITSDQWKQMLLSLCEEAVPEATQALADRLTNLMSLLIEAGRLPVLGEIAAIFHGLHLKEEGIVEVDLLSPFPASDETQERFKAMLAKRFNAKIQLHCHEDPSLIGGAVLRSGDWVMDGSVKRMLMRLKESLSQRTYCEEKS